MTKPKRTWPRVPDPATARAHVLRAEADEIAAALCEAWRFMGALTVVLDRIHRKDQP